MTEAWFSLQEQLFVSKKSVFDGRKPIRGGIPFIFPQFGQWHFGTNGPPYNGFGRIARWQCEKVRLLRKTYMLKYKYAYFQIVRPS